MLARPRRGRDCPARGFGGRSSWQRPEREVGETRLAGSSRIQAGAKHQEAAADIVVIARNLHAAAEPGAASTAAWRFRAITTMSAVEAAPGSAAVAARVV